MKYIKEFTIILLITFISEGLNILLPLPIPASIYGLIIMLILLITKVVRVYHVENVSKFLIEIMPLMFIPAGVGLISLWQYLAPIIVPVLIITVITTIIVMVITGKFVQKLLDKGEK